MELGILKVKSDLSGKKWDSAMKSLSKHGLIKVSLVGDSKIVEITN
jgi:lysyl-tRNA synthetase class 2